jgi:hypothetical protein
VKLQHDVANLRRSRITLRSGRTITLEALHQDMCYAGLLEGPPDAGCNDRSIESALREAERFCVTGAKPHLIPPARRDYLEQPGDMQRFVERSPHRTPEWLPKIRCIGSFRDVHVARDPWCGLSVLVVVWFQDDYAPPILEPALGQILSLDWESLATDIEAL